MADENSDNPRTGEGPQSAESRGGPAPAPRATRQAALWATAAALPIAILAGFLAFLQLRPQASAADPSPTSSPTASPRVYSTAPVPMAARALTPRQETVCRALLSQLPPTLRDLPQRRVSAGTEQNAAYGDPAITVACGVGAPSVPPTDKVWVVNGVCWHSAEQPDAVQLTTVDREVPVRVNVPGSYEGPLQWVAPLSATLVAAVPSAASTPAGCGD